MLSNTNRNKMKKLKKYLNPSFDSAIRRWFIQGSRAFQNSPILSVLEDDIEKYLFLMKILNFYE